MRPPECAVCDLDLDPNEGGGLVSFCRQPSDEDWYRRSEAEPGFVGHPPNVEWFCANHIDAARKLKHLSLREALQQLSRP